MSKKRVVINDNVKLINGKYCYEYWGGGNQNR